MFNREDIYHLLLFFKFLSKNVACLSVLFVHEYLNWLICNHFPAKFRYLGMKLVNILAEILNKVLAYLNKNKAQNKSKISET